MDKKLLLITATTLLYRESQLTGRSENSAGLVRSIVETVELPEVSVGVVDTERDVLVGLKTICLEMCDHDVTHQYEAIELLQKIRHAVRDDDALYNSFKEGIEGTLEDAALKRFCVNLRASLNNHVKEDKIKAIIYAAASKLRFNRDSIPDVRAYIADVQAQLEPFQSREKDHDPAIVSSVSLDNNESVAEVLGVARELNDENGIMRTGWQALNRATQGGLRRGECVVVSALQHNFKTGFTLSIFKHIAMYNKPYMLKPAKKPLLLRISFEDPLSLNLPFLYRNIYENLTGQQADFNGKTDQEIAQYISDHLQANGYHIKLMHVNPSAWTYRDVIDLMESLEAEGYEIHLLMLDYLNMLPKTGCDNTGPTGANIRDLFRRMRNYCASKKTTLITPHQMSTEAKMLIRGGMEEKFVQEVANKGYYDGCKTIDQEVDMELYFHIVKEDGRSWLTVQRGKHRVIKQTPEVDKYFVLPFEDIGDIRDDINGPDTSRRKPGGGPVGSKNEEPFWSFTP